MSFTITLELSPELESELRRSIEQSDKERTRLLLADALLPQVEELLSVDHLAPLTPEEWEELADQFSSVLTSSVHDVPPLSEYAVSRTGIYEDHP